MTLFSRTLKFAQALTNNDPQAKEELFWREHIWPVIYRAAAAGHSKAILDNVPDDFVVAIAKARGFKAEVVVGSVVVISWSTEPTRLEKDS